MYLIHGSCVYIYIYIYALSRACCEKYKLYSSKYSRKNALLSECIDTSRVGECRYCNYALLRRLPMVDAKFELYLDTRYGVSIGTSDSVPCVHRFVTEK